MSPSEVHAQRQQQQASHFLHWFDDIDVCREWAIRDSMEQTYFVSRLSIGFGSRSMVEIGFEFFSGQFQFQSLQELHAHSNSRLNLQENEENPTRVIPKARNQLASVLFFFFFLFFTRT